MNRFYTLFFLVLISACAVNKSTNSMHPYKGDEIACGNFVIYKLTENNSEYISIRVDANAIELENIQAYGIGKSDVVNVERRKFEGEVQASLCNDVMMDKPRQLLKEVAISGIVELRVTQQELEKAEAKDGYRVTVILKNVIFETQTIDYLQIDSAYVGWLPG